MKRREEPAHGGVEASRLAEALTQIDRLSAKAEQCATALSSTAAAIDQQMTVGIPPPAIQRVIAEYIDRNPYF